MAKKPASEKTPARAGASRRRKKPTARPGLAAPEAVAGPAPDEIAALGRAIEEAGGGVAGPYRDPVGGHWHILAVLPIDRVEPTPFQRDLSETHVARLADVIGRMGRFLDPIIAVRSPEGRVLDAERPPPAGRDAVARRAQSILAVVVPEIAVAYQILAMNTEKGHNLREKSLEVMRMARSLAAFDPRPEKDCALEFEEADYLTLGLAYEKRGRLSGGAYHPVLKRVEEFLRDPAAHGARDPLGAGGPAARARRQGRRGRRRAQGERLHQPVPEGVRGRAAQPAALPEGRADERGCRP